MNNDKKELEEFLINGGFPNLVRTKLPKFLEDAPIGSKSYGIKKTPQEKLDEINEMIFNQTIGRINYDLLQIGRDNGLNDYVEFDFKEYMNERSELYETFKYWLEGIDRGTSCVKENNNFSLDSLINNMKMINERVYNVNEVYLDKNNIECR